MNRTPFNYGLGNISSDGSDSDSYSNDDNDNENSDMVSHIVMGGTAKKIVLPSDKLDIVSEHFFLSIDSKDRVYSSGNTTFDFNIESFKNIYKNISSFTIQGIIVPNIYLECQQVHGLYLNSHISTSNSSDSSVIRPRQISDLNYITVQVDNIPGKTDGTNDSVRQSSGVFIIDRELEVNKSNGEYMKAEGNNNYIEFGNKSSSLLADTNYNNLVFKTIEPFKINFDTPLASLFELKFSLRDPFNNVLSLMNDYLSIHSITLNNGDELRIRTNEYFSPEEYRIGNNLLFSGLTATSVPAGVNSVSLINFLTNEKKTHPIIGYTELGTFSVASSTKLFNTLVIGLEYSLNKTTGAITGNDFNISSETVSFSSGTIINSNIQTSLFIEIETHKTFNKSLNPRMI